MSLHTMAAADSLQLTDSQQRVVDCDASAVLVTASAGTGKTEVLARRAENFLMDPQNGYAHVLAITYTNRAAAELRERLHSRIGGANPRLKCETIHGFALEVLRQHGTHVGLPLDVLVVSKDDDRVELLVRSESSFSSDDCRELLRELDGARAEGADHPQLNLWRSVLANAGAVDFGDMLAKAEEALRLPAVAHIYRRVYGQIVVDEAQNLTQAQYQLLSALVGSPAEGEDQTIPIMMLGDPKQSIIEFAGGDHRLMRRFGSEFSAEQFELIENFRSSQVLAALAGRTAKCLNGSENDVLLGAQYPARGSISGEESDSEDAEGQAVAAWIEDLLDEGLPKAALVPGESHSIEPEEIAVLGRTWSALRAPSLALGNLGLEVAMGHRGDDWATTDLGAIARQMLQIRSQSHKRTALWELGRLLDFESCEELTLDLLAELLQDRSEEHFDVLVPLCGAENPEDFVRRLAECALPKQAPEALLAGWPADQSLILDVWKEFANATDILDRVWERFVTHLELSQRTHDLGPGVRLLTIHKAQGREFKAVAIVGLNEGQFPDFRAQSEREIAGELKAFYVAVTRASRVLRLSRAEVRPTRYGPRHTQPSRYWEFVS